MTCLIVEFRKETAVLAGAAGFFDVLFLDVAELFQNIGRPGTEFAEFAVADDVDPDFLLARHRLGDRFAQLRIEGFLIDFDALLDRRDMAQ